MRNMTTARLIWCLWCLWWTVTWTCLAVFTMGLTLLLAIPSLLAILIPIGKPTRVRKEEIR